MNTILITGGAGYIGSHTAKEFLSHNFKVIVFDNLSTGFEQAVLTLKKYGDITFFKGDLRNKEDIDTVLDTYNIDAVIHFAAACSVNESMENPGKYFRNNMCGTLNLLDSMVVHNVKKLIFSSTCAVYGETQYVPVDEKHPNNPTNPYGESKYMIEKIIKWFGEIYNLKYVILRYFNVCGADEDSAVGDSKNPSVHLVQNVVRSALGLDSFKLTCAEVDTPDKTPIRDYTDVNDLARAHYLSYDYLSKGNNSDIFNIGTGKGNSVLEIVQEVENTLSTEIEKSPGEKRKGEYARIFASYDKAKEILGWEPTTSLKQSIINLRNWYQDHPEGFEI